MKNTLVRRAASDEEAIARRYRQGETLEAIGESLGITGERVRQIIARLEREHGHERGYLRRQRRAERVRLQLQRHRQRQLERDEALAYKWHHALSQLRAFYEKYGRTPYTHEFGLRPSHPDNHKHPDLPWSTVLLKAFGSWRHAFDVAGVPRRPRGTPGHTAGRFGLLKPRTGFGQWIAEQRMARNWTLAEFARRIGRTGSSATSYEHNETPVSLPMLQKIAQAFDIPLSVAVSEWEKHQPSSNGSHP